MAEDVRPDQLGLAQACKLGSAHRRQRKEPQAQKLKPHQEPVAASELALLFVVVPVCVDWLCCPLQKSTARVAVYSAKYW